MSKFSSRQTREDSVAKVIGHFFWLTFLLVVVCFSFLTQRFDTSLWQVACGSFFAIFTAFLILQLISPMAINQAGLKSAKPALCLMFAIPGWLFLQFILPGDGERLVFGEFNHPSPEWWRPIVKISITPVNTFWLALSSLFLACWSVFAVSLLTTRSRLRQLLWVLFITALLHAISGVMALKLDLFLVDKGQVDGHFDVARGWFVNRNHYAASLAIGGAASIPLLQYYATKAFATAKRSLPSLLSVIAVLLGSIIIVGAILASQSRAGVLAPVVMLGLMGVAIIVPKFGFKLGLVGIATMFLSACGVLLIFGDQWVTRLTIESFSLGERWLQWKVTLVAILDAPIFGYGGGSYGTVFQIFRDHTEFRQVIYNQSHNQFLHVWLEQGVVGLTIWLLLLGVVFWRIVVSLKTTKSRLARSVSWACFVVMGASVLQSLVDFNLQIISILSLFYLFIAIAFAVPSASKQKR